jgi:hypothetical protein
MSRTEILMDIKVISHGVELIENTFDFLDFNRRKQKIAERLPDFNLLEDI